MTTDTPELKCEKIPHTWGGMLHDEADDSLYDVDGVMYCGRCHHVADKGRCGNLANAVPAEGQIWYANDGFIARVELVWPQGANPRGPPWANVAYRRASGGRLVNMRIDRFCNRFSRQFSSRTGPFE